MVEVQKISVQSAIYHSRSDLHDKKVPKTFAKPKSKKAARKILSCSGRCYSREIAKIQTGPKVSKKCAKSVQKRVQKINALSKGKRCR